jgi:hypothetical protein
MLDRQVKTSERHSGAAIRRQHHSARLLRYPEHNGPQFVLNFVHDALRGFVAPYACRRALAMADDRAAYRLAKALPASAFSMDICSVTPGR